MENNLAHYASVMQEMQRNGWNVHLLADIVVGHREPADDAMKQCYQDRINSDEGAQSEAKGSDEIYRDFHIVYAPPPIPVRNADWQFCHKDYDGAPDSNDGRCGFAASLEEAKAEIDEMIAQTRCFFCDKLMDAETAEHWVNESYPCCNSCAEDSSK